MYEYDNAGNITAKKKYAFTTGTLGAVQATYTYSYNDSSWGDLLTSYDSTTIVYDEIGNPVRIGNYNAANDVWWDGYDLTWVGRQLMSYTAFYRYDADEELSYRTPVTFTYNADGIRTGKTTYGYEHKYYLDGTQITAEMWTQNNVEYLLYYLYDENGAPIGLQYRTSDYASGIFDFFFFDKNLQGDIIGIYNADGEKICTYTYDAWGICNIALTSGISSLERNVAVTYNPFRYRGYYYDTETGLYYLQSRYYNPEWGRFLNADGYVNANGDIIGFNIFAYCGNNPIIGIDPTGKWTFSTGFQFSAFLFAGVSFSICLSFDSEGNIAIQTTKANVFEPNAGVVLGAASIGVSTYSTYTYLDTIDELEGITYNIGGTIPVINLGLEANMTSDYELVGATASTGIGIGVDVHFSATKTTTIGKFNIVDAAKNLWEKIKGVFTW